MSTMKFCPEWGGGELGKVWHDGGRLLRKRNSFHDFIACAETLVEQGFADVAQLAAKGASAGGLLVAAAVNMRPDLFRAVILKVPFLDVTRTMQDPQRPLTVADYHEWGDPADEEHLRNMRAYSPCTNIREVAAYPAAYVTASLLDTRVGYWEAAKWVSRVRGRLLPKEAGEEPHRPVLLTTSSDTGHFGEGGRYMHLAHRAREYAFLIKYVQESKPSTLD
eukprot:jgi/Mesen1/3176/ME000184S02254